MWWIGHYDLDGHHDELDGFQRRTNDFADTFLLDDNMNRMDGL
jgi:hypothetical protein